MISAAFALIFFCLCLFAAFKDTLTLLIPNWLNLSIVILFVPAAFASQIGWQLMGAHLIAGAIAFVVSFGLFAFRIFGGGDSKMIPGVVLWVGPAGAMHFVFGMAMMGGLLSIIVFFMRRMVPAEVAPGFAQSLLNQENGVPYGVAIAAGGFYAAGQSPLLIGLVNLLNGIH